MVAQTVDSGDLEEIEQDVEEQIQIAIANGEFEDLEGQISNFQAFNMRVCIGAFREAKASQRKACSKPTIRIWTSLHLVIH